MRLIRKLGAIALVLLPTLAANADVIQIEQMENPHVVIDFGTFDTGVTSVDAINAAAPGAGILSIFFELGGPAGRYNTRLGSGNALAADGLGGLTIVPELGVFASSVSMGFRSAKGVPGIGRKGTR